MSMTKFQKITLGIAGVTAFGIGCFILAAPHALSASYGITPGADPNLLSELRAPATNLAALGAVMLAGIIRPSWAQISTAVALTVFLAFPAGRIMSIVFDGMPSESILGALVIEILIAALCLAAFGRRPARKSSRKPNHGLYG
jgi:hypothetical protein